MAPTPNRGTPPTSWAGVPSRVQAACRARVAATLPAPCTICGVTMRVGETFDLDHILPIHLGGSVLDPSNHGPAHPSCNRSSGASSGNIERSRDRRRLRRW